MHNTEWKQKKYLQACKILDQLNKQGNFCGISSICDGISYKNKCNSKIHESNELCCVDCRHLKQNGCSVESISCKMNFCYFGFDAKDMGLVTTRNWRNYKRFEFVKEIIINFFNKNDIPFYQDRMSMEETFILYEQQGY